ncbi:MAG: 3-hydroxyacyl-CoA dehydrogenase NAD-binding domain-containing protein [Deltaproteobacteria bacterium]|nr:3-hydroxyacyl-CoA dehydrogenase NAD-binding domain-containing protein [Deltaproteobacteria bacterium]
MSGTIARIGVVGAGQMGGGIAQIMAQAGIVVQLMDTTLAQAQHGKQRITAQLDRLVEKGKLAADERTAIINRIVPVSAYRDLADVDFVVEAASESLAVKQQIFTDLDRACRPGVILASNTSSISITALSSRTRRPDRVIGVHFMNPVPLMKLVELIRGLPTSDETYDVARGLVERLGKQTVVSRDIPGFIVNRVLMPLCNEACFTFYENIGTIEDIDRAITLGLNHPMGPFALMDLIGLDTTLAILEVMHRELGESKYRPCPLLRQYVAAGWLGRKSGRGFYTYS